MPERIRYAWGESSLGEFIAAVSERGLVAFEFTDGRVAALEGLQARLPDASLEEDRQGLAELVGQLATLSTILRPIRASPSMLAGATTKSRFGRWCVRFPLAKRRITVPWPASSTRATLAM
jgi:O6-methylguanine-DNA--protein-cysteine methyltransferase